MEYVFYIDVFFVTDFFLNFLALWLAAVVLRRRPKVRILRLRPRHLGTEWNEAAGQSREMEKTGRTGRSLGNLLRMSLAAMIGSGWNCLIVIFPMLPSWAELILTVTIVGTAMCFAAFGGQWRFLAKADATLLLTSALLNGCVSFSRQHFFLTDFECLAFTGIVAGLSAIFLEKAMQAQAIGKERYHVRLYYRGNSKEFTALADSGNRLHVPQTGKPVSLISFGDCHGLCEKVSGGYYIPYRAVGTDHGLLFAITFEKMEILKNGMCITIENPAVAIAKSPLFASGDFNMILPEEYVLQNN